MKTLKLSIAIIFLAVLFERCQPKTDQAAILNALAEGKKIGYDSAENKVFTHESGHVGETYPPQLALSKTSSGACTVMYGLVISDAPASKNDTLVFINMLERFDTATNSMCLSSPIDYIEYDRRPGKKVRWINNREYPLAIPISRQ
jgi:hypothetical protein